MISNRRHYRLLTALADRPMNEMEILDTLNCRPSDLRLSLEEVLASGYVVENEGLFEVSESGMEFLGIISGEVEVIDGRRPGYIRPMYGFGRGRRFCQPGMRRGRPGFAGRGNPGRGYGRRF